MQRKRIAITATFTAEPLEPFLAFWMQVLGIPTDIEFAPYNQLFQQLLDPESLLSNNQHGINVLLLRLEDWHRQAPTPPHSSQIEQTLLRNVKDLAVALESALDRSPAPTLVCVCPPSPRVVANTRLIALFQDAEDLLATELHDIPAVYLVTPSELSSTYPASSYHNTPGVEQGHIPYNTLLFASLSTMIARRIHAIQSPPHKVVVLDCDQTLWRGVVGEIGPLRIEVDPHHALLQEFMVAQHDAGMLICLCSKNTEADVVEVFRKRSEMPLKRDHIVSWRINWQPKSANLALLAAELQLGLDSFIFVDDDPVECAEVEANCPDVTTVCLPSEEADIPRFLDHIWVFDHLKTTNEDKARTAVYQQNFQREQCRKEAMSFAEFLEGLELQVQIIEMPPHQVARVAQLTQRTNQFNTATIRRSEGEIHKCVQSGEREFLIVNVKDRFGDYGLVGAITLEASPESIKVHSFLLSCRTLGRGVEHRMLARLATIARQRGLSHVEVTYMPTAKNQPVLDFLTSVGAECRLPLGDGLVFRFPVERLLGLTYRPSAPTAGRWNHREVENPASAHQVALSVARSRMPSSLLRRIALELYDAEKVLEAANSHGCRSRPELERAYVQPRSELEHLLARMWRRVLGIETIGIYDNFFELGGDSIKGAMFINELQQIFGEMFHVVALFDAPTIADLLGYLARNYPRVVSSSLGVKSAPETGAADMHLASITSGGRIDPASVAMMRQLVTTLRPRACEDIALRLLPSSAKNSPAVFVLAPPRSGTTLLRVMLGGHPRIFAPPELLLLSFNTLAERRIALSGRNSPYLEGTVRAIMEIKACSAEGATTIMEEYERQGMTSREFYRLMQEWIGERILVDKTPWYALDLEILKRAEADFDGAIYIHLLRHPYAMIQSFERARLDRMFFCDHSFSARDLAELVWLISHQNTLEFLNSVPDHRHCCVKYEDLVSKPREIMDRICSVLGLEFHPSMLLPYEDKRQRMTDGIHPVSRMVGDFKFHEYTGIDSKAASRWREKHEWDFLGDITWEVVERLGYERGQTTVPPIRQGGEQ